MEVAIGAGLACPSPFEPILPGKAQHTVCQPSVIGQLARRAEILAATRRTIADAGHERFTVKSVSEHCMVTVQTIYNSFGCRQELLVHSLNEHTVLMENTAENLSPGGKIFLALADLYYRCALERPEFLSEIVMAAFATRERLRIMQRHSIQNKARILKKLSKNDFVGRPVDLTMLATQITRVNSFAIYEWAHHGDARDLRRQMLEGNELLLRGVLKVSDERDYPHQ